MKLELRGSQEIMASGSVQPNQPAGAHLGSVPEFEKNFGQQIGGQYCLAVNSGTSAVHLALLALGVRPGDQVICPTYTYVATVNPILYCQAQPVFVDSEPYSWNMCPELLDEAIRSKANRNSIRAIIVVHINGTPADLDNILKVARRYGIPVVEDAAQALGSKFHNKQVGTWGAVGTFSFNNNKILTTYGGGMMVTSDKGLIEIPAYLSSHAKSKLPFFEHTEVGYNYRMNGLAANYGQEQLPLLSDHVLRKREIWNRYQLALEGTVGISFQNDFPSSFSNRWNSAIKFDDPTTATQVRNRLAELGFGHGFGWRPMHRQPVFETLKYQLTGAADQLFESVVHLPSHLQLSRKDQDKIAEEIVGLN